MRDGTITTRADVYAQEIPDAFDSVIVTSDSTLLQTSTPVADYNVPDREENHEHGGGGGDGDESRVGRIGNSTATVGAHPASSKRLTLCSESTDTDDRTQTIESDVCDAGPTPPIAESAFEFGSEPDGRADPEPRTLPDPESKISRIQMNWLDTDKKKPVVRRNDNSCVVDCIYFTQQCCECVIF